MRVFVTGGSGFVGKALTGRLLDDGHEVVALVRDGDLPERKNLEVVRGDLSAPDARWFGGRRVDVAVHCAWVAAPGEYLTSPRNAEFVRWSEGLLPILAGAGVGRVVGVGTCLECPPSESPMPEDMRYPGFEPYSEYGRAKREWMEILEGWAKREGVRMAWARLFYPYGPGEHRGRFLSYLIRELAGAREVVLKTPGSQKDYIYISDVASALAVLCGREEEGVFHVGSGEGYRIADLAAAVVREMGAPGGLVKILPVEERVTDHYPFHVAGNARLKKLGWKPETGLEEGVRSLVKERMRHETND